MKSEFDDNFEHIELLFCPDVDPSVFSPTGLGSVSSQSLQWFQLWSQWTCKRLLSQDVTSVCSGRKTLWLFPLGGSSCSCGTGTICFYVASLDVDLSLTLLVFINYKATRNDR